MNNDLKLVKSETFGDMNCNFYKNSTEEIFVTRAQIGKALGYSNPNKAIKDIHMRHKERLDKFSRGAQIALSSGGIQETIVYNAKGVYEICRYSNQPKANDFYDWVYDVLESIRKTGGYQIPKNPMEALSLMFEVQKETTDKIDKLDNRMVEIEENAPLNPGEYMLISTKVAEKIRNVKREYKLENATREQNSVLYKAINSEIKEITGIKTRSQLRKKHLDMVLDFIRDWEPSKATMVIVNQLSLDVESGVE